MQQRITRAPHYLVEALWPALAYGLRRGSAMIASLTLTCRVLPSLLLGSSLFLGACSSSGDGKSDQAAGKSGNGAGTSGGGASGTVGDCMTTADPGEVVPVAAGDFVMGCSDGCDDDEAPMHTVTLSAFDIDRTEVTQAQYRACLLDGGCEAPSCDWSCDEPDLPAICVTWTQARAYCAWAGKRLPTEAEWEKAARGKQGNKYPWGNAEPDCSRANMAGCGSSAQPVGSLEAGASPYGALDMAGNAVELVADWYDASYYASSPAKDPPGPSTGKRYSGRGGGFKSDGNFVRSSKRDWYDPTDTAPSLGFRCAH